MKRFRKRYTKNSWIQHTSEYRIVLKYVELLGVVDNIAGMPRLLHRIPALLRHATVELMFDHVVIGASDYEASKEFFLKALEPLGIAVLSEGPLGIELSTDGKSSLCICPTKEKPTYLHLAFTAENRQQVDAFYRAALVTAEDNGAPGLRPKYSGRYYAAFVIGPDGHNIEVVCHES